MKLSVGKVFLVFFLLLLFLKTDYRLVDGIYCCKDDHDYFAHAETISIDFDFDYSNQFKGNEDSRFYYNGKSAPKAFFGSGLLASPFLFFGNLIDSYLMNSKMYNFKIIFYSFSPIIYLFFSLLIVNEINKLANSKFNPYLLYLFLLGSGIGYYAFERFSMSHVYEVFTILLIIFFSMKFYTLNDINSNYAFLIPFSILISILTRWVNFYIILIPLIVKLLFFQESIKLLKSKKFIFSTLLSITIFTVHTYLIYGVVTFNPEFVYGATGTVNNYLNSEESNLNFILSNFNNFLKIFFGQEFGLIWFSPIIFFGFYIILKELFNQKNIFKNKVVFIVGALCFLQILSLVLIWKAPGSSYAFRYALNLAPLSILFLISSNSVNRVELTFFKYLSIFSIFSVLFFESTVGTQLSLELGYNSFGKFTRYVQPNYLSGYLNSLFDFEAYLKILAQSYLGFFLFAIILNFINVENLTNFLGQFSEAAYNDDLQNLFYKITEINFYKIIFSILVLYLLSYYLIKLTTIEKQSE